VETHRTICSTIHGQAPPYFLIGPFLMDFSRPLCSLLETLHHYEVAYIKSPHTVNKQIVSQIQ